MFDTETDEAPASSSSSASASARRGSALSKQLAVGCTAFEISQLGADNENLCLSFARVANACGFDWSTVYNSLPKESVTDALRAEMSEIEQRPIRLLCVPRAKIVLRNKARYLEIFANWQFARIANACPPGFARKHNLAVAEYT